MDTNSKQLYSVLNAIWLPVIITWVPVKQKNSNRYFSTITVIIIIIIIIIIIMVIIIIIIIIIIIDLTLSLLRRKITRQS